MFITCLLSVSLALAASATPSAPPDARAEPPTYTLWLVQPLYPGQDTLVKRTEDGIRALLPPESKAHQLIGRDALAGFLQDRRGDLGCVSGAARCREPMEAYLASLRLERVVLVQVGQDDTGYRVRAVSLRPETGTRSQAETTNPAFDKALTGALVRFMSLNATVEAVTESPGATVFIDGVKVGTTPLTTEVLPGEHTFRFEQLSHLPREETRVVGSRETVRLAPVLEWVPARLVVKAQPAEAEIRVDGKPVGRGALDQGIQPGKRTLALVLEGYEPHEVQADIAPGATYTLEQTLKPTSMQAFKLAMRRRQEATMARQSYLEVSFEQLSLSGTDVATRPVSTPGPLRDFQTLDVRLPGTRRLRGLGLEYGRYGQYFGVMLAGATYASSSDTWTMGIRVPDAAEGAAVENLRAAGQLDTQAQMLSVRALQPQIRYVVGPVSFGLQAGLELQGVLLKQRVAAGGTAPLFEDGLYAVDLHASGKATARVFIYEGLYASVAYQRSFALLNKIAGTSNLRGGLGYAF